MSLYNHLSMTLRNCHLPCTKTRAETNYLFRFSCFVRLLCARNTSGTGGSESARRVSLLQVTSVVVSDSVTEISV